LFALAGALDSRAAAPPVNPEPPLPNLHLRGVNGRGVRLHGLKGRPAVIAFLSFDCPTSLGYTQALNDLARRHGARASFLAVCPTGEEPSHLAREAKAAKLSLPVFRDARREAARAFSARTVPEAFVLDANLAVRYRGRIDDGYSARLKRKP